jgi:hypothetical protein
MDRIAVIFGWVKLDATLPRSDPSIPAPSAREGIKVAAGLLPTSTVTMIVEDGGVGARAAIALESGAKWRKTSDAESSCNLDILRRGRDRVMVCANTLFFAELLISCRNGQESENEKM